MKVIGQVVDIKNESGTSKAGNEWKKRVVVVEFTSNGGIKHIAAEMFGESKIEANPVRKGQYVEMTFEVDSKEYNGRWYTGCSVVRIEKSSNKNGVGFVGEELDEPQVIDTTILEDDSALPF